MRRLSKKYTISWIVLIASFFVIEGLALRNPERGDTLSEHIWRVQEWGGSLFYALVLAVIFWGLWHFSPFEKARKR